MLSGSIPSYTKPDGDKTGSSPPDYSAGAKDININNIDELRRLTGGKK